MVTMRWFVGAAVCAIPLAGGPLACSSSAPTGQNEEALTECSSDDDCKGDRVCEGGECVDAATTTSSSTGTGPSSSSTSGDPPGPNCSKDAGEACQASEECCGYPSDTTCVNFEGYGPHCADYCSSDSQCASGCCGALDGGGSVCAPAEFCGGSCVQTGDSCSSNGDCCNYKAGDGWCADTGGGYGYICRDECSYDSECNSGCCVLLDNGSSVCGQASACN